MTTRPEDYARLARSAEPRVAAQYASDALAGDPERGTMEVAHSPVFVHTTAETNARRADARRRARILRDAWIRAWHRPGCVRYGLASRRQEAIGNGERPDKGNASDSPYVGGVPVFRLFA